MSSTTALQKASGGEASASASSPPRTSDAETRRRTSSAGNGEDDPEDVGAQQATNLEVESLLKEVRSSLATDVDVTTGEEEDAEEARDKIAEHMDLAGLTLDDKDPSNASSASNSVAASPAVAPSHSDTSAASSKALDSVPNVELSDGGNATMEATAKPKENFYDVRVAIVGNVDSGKSTLIGVLTGGALDDGRGKARSKVFIHAHELGTGRTSAISQHIMGFDANNQPVHQTVAASAQSAVKSKSWATVIAASKHIMTFVDLAGHEKYLKTTIAGLTGSHPDYAVVLVNSLAGVTKMTKEHLGVVLALEIPLICVVTKVDLVPSTVLESSKKQLWRILKSSAANKTPIQMRSEKDIETVINSNEESGSNKICPVFFISAVNGTHINLLTDYLARLKPHHEWLQQYARHMTIPRNPDGTPAAGSNTSHPSAVEFSIDEVFNVSGVGIVVSGTLNSGTLTTNQTLLLGPQGDNSFIQVLVRSLHYKRTSAASVEAGQSCAISIRAVKRKETLKRNLIRRGQVLVDPIVQPKSTRVFDAEVLILHHPTTIKHGYQAVLHCGMIRQTAQILKIMTGNQAQEAAAAAAAASSGSAAAGATGSCLRTGDKSICRFRFMLREEYIHTGASFVFREGSTKGIGKITRIHFTDEELAEIEGDEKLRRKPQGLSQQPKANKETGDGETQPASAAPATAAAVSTSTSATPAKAADASKNKSIAKPKDGAAAAPAKEKNDSHAKSATKGDAGHHEKEKRHK